MSLLIGGAANGNPFHIDRLPAGSVKTLTWNGEQWDGLLTVPGCPEFRCSAGGEKACFHSLDHLYRSHLAGAKK